MVKRESGCHRWNYVGAENLMGFMRSQSQTLFEKTFEKELSDSWNYYYVSHGVCFYFRVLFCVTCRSL